MCFVLAMPCAPGQNEADIASVVLVLWSGVMDHEVFPIARGSSAPLWFCGVIGVLVFGLGAFLGTLWLFGSRIVTLEVSDRGVRVRGDVYGRFIPREALRVEQAKVLDLATDPGYSPVARTNGIGLPDYQSGWFRLANGSSALLFVTNWSRAVRVPTTERFDLLVSPSDPQAFLAALDRPTTTGVTFPHLAPGRAFDFRHHVAAAGPLRPAPPGDHRADGLPRLLDPACHLRALGAGPAHPGRSLRPADPTAA